MKKFIIAAVEFTEDQIQVTAIRETVMPDAHTISKVETYTTDRASFPRTLLDALDDYTELLISEYTQGLRGLREEMEPDSDPDDMEIRN